MDDSLAPILFGIIYAIIVVSVMVALVWAAHQDGKIERHHRWLSR